MASVLHRLSLGGNGAAINCTLNDLRGANTRCWTLGDLIFLEYPGGRHVAIDPQPFLGEPEFDVPTFLWNPLPCRLRVDLIESRLAAFVAAGLDEERIRIWTVIRGAYLQPQEAEALRALV